MPTAHCKFAPVKRLSAESVSGFWLLGVIHCLSHHMINRDFGKKGFKDKYLNMMWYHILWISRINKYLIELQFTSIIKY